MISRSRAIVKDLKLMKNLGWLTNRENWLIFAKHHLPKRWKASVERLRIWPIEKVLLKRYRWVKLTRNHGEMIVPLNFLTQSPDGEVSTASMLEASTLMIHDLLFHSWPYPRGLKLTFIENKITLLPGSGRKMAGPIRLMLGWSVQEQEELFFNLRQNSQAEVSFEIEGSNKSDQLVAQLNCKLKIEVLRRLELSRKDSPSGEIPKS